MKKIINKLNFAIIGIMASMPAFAADAATRTTSGGGSKDICSLIEEMSSLFKILRTLAFLGAAFYIAGWAWNYISSGKAEVKDIKEKGTGLLVGFILLFAIGVLLSFVLGVTDGSIWCEDVITKL